VHYPRALTPLTDLADGVVAVPAGMCGMGAEDDHRRPLSELSRSGARILAAAPQHKLLVSGVYDQPGQEVTAGEEEAGSAEWRPASVGAMDAYPAYQDKYSGDADFDYSEFGL
jgi:hypothetical protein